MKFSNAEFELFVANYYTNKVQSCKDRGIEWKLSLISVRNLLRTERCPYSGIKLTMPRSGKQALSSDITIDRIDNKRPYEPGNVMAVSNKINNLKSIFENPDYGLSFEDAAKIFGKINKRLTKCKERN